MTEHFNIKRYNRRWMNLFLFVMYAINNGIHWGQYSAISGPISEYYNVSPKYVEWTSGLFNLSYVLFFTPGLYVMKKIKMKYIMIFAGFLSTLGAWIKVFSVVPDRFLLAFIGQTLIAASYTFTFGVSANLIASWFGIHESSRASALSLLGDQFGGAISFLIPVIMVEKSSDNAIWENSLRRMHITNASVSTVVLALIIFVFKDQPKNPPSMVQALKKETKSEVFIKALPKVMKNRAFLMLLFWYSIIGMMMNTLGAVIGQLITINFPGSEDDAGKIGFLMTASGMFSTPIFGYIMDKTHRFKEIGIALSAGSFITFSIFTWVLKLNNIVYVYLIAIGIGIFMNSAYVNGIQIGVEILYPVSEDQCSALMVFVMQLMAAIFLYIYGEILPAFGDLNANLISCILTLAGLVVSIFTTVRLNRYEAEQKSSAKEMKEFIPNSGLQTVKH